MPMKQKKAKNQKLKMPKGSDDFAKGADADEGAQERGLDKRLGMTKNLAPSIKGKGSLAQALQGK